jgi:DNA-binding response OmpR family regulator
MYKESAGSVVNRVLLVDDSPADLRLLVQLLSQENFKVLVALHGRQAIERALAVPGPDLIVMDVSMPGLDGYATCRLLKADPSTAHIPIIFVTAASALDERLKGFQAGGVDYVLKPYDPAEVLARVRVHLNRLSRGDANVHQSSAASDSSSPIRTLGQLDAASRVTPFTNDQAIVNTTTRYLHEHLADAPPQKHLAKLMGVNEKRLTYAFRTLLGKTVHDFLRDERMDRAQTLLRDDRLSVAEISDRLGFSSPANFASAFRRQVGCSPLMFRRQQCAAKTPLPCTSEAH